MRARPRKRFAASIGVLLLGLGLVACNDSIFGPRRKPNVILIVIDTLRADHLGSYGYERDTSPSLDRFASEALLFRNAISQAPWTAPSIAALFSSRYAGEVGYEGNRSLPKLPDHFLTLPEIFAANGYRTTAIVSHTYISEKLGFAQGFEHFDDSNSRGHLHTSSPSIVEKASHFLVDDRDSPFFLFLHFFDPHFAYLLRAPHHFDSGYTQDSNSILRQKQLVDDPETTDPADIDRMVTLYDSEIRYTDEHLGQLFELLRDRELYDDALIAVTADHGEAFNEREPPFIGHGTTLYQELIRVPLLIKLPGRFEGREIEKVVGLVDLVPTIVDTLELGVPDDYEFEGRALPLRKPSRIDKLRDVPLFSETKVEGTNLQSVILGKWKLVVDRNDGRRYLYDLRGDPGETSELSATQPEVVKRYADLLSRWTNEVRAKRGGYRPERTELTPEEVERLRALGYTDS